MSSIQPGLPDELRAARASSQTRSVPGGPGLPPGLAARLARAVQHEPELAPDPLWAGAVADPLARAALLASMAERVLAAWLAQPRAGRGPVPGGVVTLHLAVEIDTDTAQPGTSQSGAVQPGAARGIRVLQIGAGSPRATAWQAGFLDARTGLVPRFAGPAELEADYWVGVDAALRHGEG